MQGVEIGRLSAQTSRKNGLIIAGDQYPLCRRIRLVVELHDIVVAPDLLVERFRVGTGMEQVAQMEGGVDQALHRNHPAGNVKRVAGPGMDVVSEVVSGRAQYGVGNSSLLLARQQGKPVVALAAIFSTFSAGFYCPR